MVAELCGEDIARALSSHFGGSVLYVPASGKTTGRIEGALNADQAARLQSEFGGESLYIPSNNRRDEKPAKYAQIVALEKQGLNSGEIATALQISQSYVFQLRREFAQLETPPEASPTKEMPELHPAARGARRP